jgi:hypothetical protein
MGAGRGAKEEAAWAASGLGRMDRGGSDRAGRRVCGQRPAQEHTSGGGRRPVEGSWSITGGSILDLSEVSVWGHRAVVRSRTGVNSPIFVGP